jgi:hypothetical protein
MTTQTAIQSQPKAYNLHTVGMGFINRLRFVKPEGKGKGYWCTSIGALYGVEDENGRSESSLYDLRVVGAKAIESAQALQAAFDEGKKIFVEFKAGDTRADAFQYKRGPKQGQWGACIKGTLLQIRKAWVEGQLVIDNSQPESAEAASESQVEETSVTPADPTPVATATGDESPAPHWRERLKARPERLVIDRDDPECNDKLWEINALGCYKVVPAARPNCVAFALVVKSVASAA